MSETKKSDPDWWKKGVFYQIYPRSYKDSSGNGVGDLTGITDRLEYIADLGVDGIWISPFFQSPMKDFGYDVSDYRQIDPLFGTNEDFDTLLKKAHNLNIKIIVDMVLSHTSIEHPWFQESRLSSDNRKADWYVWANPNADGTPPNNWQSVFGGPAWTFDTKRGQYYMHNFLSDQPDLNFHNPAVQDQLLSECKYWLERGVDGFRLDTVNFYFHNQELTDNPPRNPDSISTGLQLETVVPYTMQAHIHDKSQPENFDFLKRLRSLMDEYDARMTIGEIGDDDPYRLAGEYTAGGDKLNTTYNTHFMAGTSGTEFNKSLIEIPLNAFASVPGDGWPSWAFCNHDVVRVATRWGKNVKDKEAFAKMLMKLLLSLRGTPFIYQGEELGLPEASIPFEKLQDPWGIYMWPEWQGRDGCRTPMPWEEKSTSAGFSNSEETWLPIPHEHAARAVDSQDKNPDSVLSSAKEFIKWRKTKPALQLGEMAFVESGHDDIIIFDRAYEGQNIRCVFNIREKTLSYEGQDLKPFEALFIEE